MIRGEKLGKGQKLFTVAVVIVVIVFLMAVLAMNVTGNETSLRKITLSIKRDEFLGKPPWAGGPGGPNDGGGGGKEQGKGYKLSAFVINPANDEGISENLVIGEIRAAFDEWDDNVPDENIFTYGKTTTASGAVDDGDNVISFAAIDGEGNIIAQATIWYNPATKNVLEYDIVFDSSEEWGVDSDGEGTEYEMTGAFDLRDIATHEAGHTLVLEDLYEDKYSEMTMYGYTTLGETKKRSIEWGTRTESTSFTDKSVLQIISN